MLAGQTAGNTSRRHSTSHRMRQKYKLGTDLEGDELWKLLETKESDLLLAAELGSALLSKNEEISKQREVMTEEFTQRLEVRS